MVDIGTVWSRIEAHAGEDFRLVRGDLFQYEVPGNYLLPVGRVRHLSRTNFAKALDRLPLEEHPLGVRPPGTVVRLRDPHGSSDSAERLVNRSAAPSSR